MNSKEELLKIIERTRKALQDQDVVRLKELSDESIGSASASQEPHNIALAVIIYSLSKIIEKSAYINKNTWDKFYKGVILEISHSVDAIKKSNEEHLNMRIEGLRKKIEELSGNMKRNIQEVFRKASINKASKIYEGGISMEKTSKLLGITMFDLASYAGSRQDTYSFKQKISAKERIKIAEEIFR